VAVLVADRDLPAIVRDRPLQRKVPFFQHVEIGRQNEARREIIPTNAVRGDRNGIGLRRYGASVPMLDSDWPISSASWPREVRKSAVTAQPSLPAVLQQVPAASD
jgi:hypothetical protein